MDINLLPEGARVLVDSNLFLYQIGGSSVQCKHMFARIAAKELHGYITTTIIAEVLHRQMLIEAVSKGLVTPGRALKKLKEDPTLITILTDYATEIEKLLRLPLRIIDVKSEDILRSHALRLSHGLFVNDSINLACAEREGIQDIATHDADFRRVPSIRVWEPTDV